MKKPPLRIGLIGLDTSHAPAFVRILNGDEGRDWEPAGRIVTAYAGGSPDVEASASRIDAFVRQIHQDWQIPLAATIPDLVEQVDAVIVTSVDGRVHLEQAGPAIRAGKPVFIDKPMAASLQHVQKIFDLADAQAVPCFSSSSLRFYDGLVNLKEKPGLGQILGADVYTPCPLEPHHPDLMWYGIHGVEILFTLLGAACESVRRIPTPETDLICATWSGNRLASLRGIRSGKQNYGATVYGTDDIRSFAYQGEPLYINLLKHILQCFDSGTVPVPRQETEMMFRFMHAADLSAERNGATVSLHEM